MEIMEQDIFLCLVKKLIVGHPYLSCSFANVFKTSSISDIQITTKMWIYVKAIE
jgi:hypothetical protein